MENIAPYRLVRLANGVWSVHSHAHRETFHPVVGPAAEAEALYVRQFDLGARLQAHQGEFVVWDVGLGAAANAIAILRATRDLPFSIRLVSFDHTLEPLAFAVEHPDELGYLDGYEPRVRELLAHGKTTFTDGAQSVHWQAVVGDFPTLLAARRSPTEAANPRPGAAASTPHDSPLLLVRPPRITSALPKPHAIMFDAFSPAKNPAMWTQSLFNDLFHHLDPARPCAVATYSRSTLLRVSLLLAGFYVGSGQATGEKEETTIAANAPELIARPLGADWLRRAHRSSSAEPLWEPHYRQAPLAPATWERLQQHPQFNPQQPSADETAAHAASAHATVIQTATTPPVALLAGPPTESRGTIEPRQATPPAGDLR